MLLGTLRVPALPSHLRGSAAAAVFVQQPVWRLPDVPRLRQHHRARHGSGGARPVEVDRAGRDRAVEQAALSIASRRAEARGEGARPAPRRAVARPRRRRPALRRRGRRRRLRGHPRLLPLARAEEVQGARARVPQPLSRLSHLSRLRRHAAAARSARRARRRPDHRSRVGAHRERSAAASSPTWSCPKRTGRHCRQGAEGDPAPARLSGRRRARLPDARSAVVHALGRRGAAHQSRHVARLGAGRHALRARRAVDRPAHARQPAADRHPAAAARSGQHRARRRARRRHDLRGRSCDRHGARRRRARRPRGLRRHARGSCAASRAR